MPICRSDKLLAQFTRHDSGTRVRVQGGEVSTRYEMDVVAWANEQTRPICAGCFDLLDLEHMAEEIGDVGKSEQCGMANRMAVLLVKYHPNRRGSSDYQ